MGHAIGRFLTTLLLAALCNTVLADLATDTGPAPGPGLHDILNQLASRSFDDKETAIRQLAEQDHPRVVPLLNALMNRDLVQHRDSGAILLGRKNSDGWLLLDPVSEAEQQQVGSRDARPVVINNRLRTVINNQLALRDLASPDSEQRYQAAGQLIGNADPEMLSALTARRAKETVARVQDRIDVALNIATLDNNDLAARLNAIDALADSLHPAAKNALRDRVAASDNPAEVRAAEKALARIEARIERYQAADTLFFGLSLGSV